MYTYSREMVYQLCEVAHLRCLGSSEATTPPAESAEAPDATVEDVKDEAKDTSAGEEPAASAEGESAPDEAPQEPAAEGKESTEPEKPKETSDPPADESAPKQDDDNGNNGSSCLAT